MRRLRLLAVAVVTAALVLPMEQPAQGATPRHVGYTQWATAAQLRTGVLKGVVVSRGKLVLGTPIRTTKLAGTRYDVGRWLSPWVSPGFDLTELVPSWHARTPGRSLVQVDVRGISAAGTSTGWDTVSRWAAGDRHFKRTSLGAQTDGGASVAYDTWLAPAGVRRYQLRITLLGRSGASLTPAVETVGAMSSRLPSVSSVATSRPTGLAAGRVLRVPRYSQMIHQGEYPQYDGGGEAWCSPTSTSMVLGYYGRLPSASAYSWVNPSYPERFVAHAARMTFDHSFQGTGNWPFNTAYAASLTRSAFVTRLRDLREAERFIAAGIPLVASVSFGSGQLAGAPISSTNGHLLVIVGFRADGDVVVNDPASRTKRGVRRTYDRGQFEDAWLKRYRSGSSMKGSGGLVYVIRTPDRPLPARAGSRGW